jgi:DNA-binding HxlR family transcriptional regulator
MKLSLTEILDALEMMGVVVKEPEPQEPEE